MAYGINARTLDHDPLGRRAGDLTAAEGVPDTLMERRPGYLWGVGLAGITAAEKGERDAAEKATRSLASLDDPYPQSERSVARAGILAWLGRKDEAVGVLRRGFREGLRYGVLLHSGALLDALRGVPPIEDLMRPHRS